jgi:c-di-GMP-binding flagellar brake protein YcgR
MQQECDELNDTDERRRFFRIEDAVHMNLRVVSKAELEQRLQCQAHKVSDSFSLMIGLNAIGQQVSAALRRIEAKDPDVADYLKALDKKVDLISKAFLVEEVDIADKPARAVNLSAGGMALHAKEQLEAGSILEIRMLLLPSYTGIVTYGTLVDCSELSREEGDNEYPYLLRVDFSFMRDTERDALIRHILQKQAEWLRRRREERERREDAL